MFKWIRWLGLIPFVIIVSSVVLFFVFFASVLLKGQIQTHATQANGAKVDVASVRLTLQPIGFEIRNMQVANPEQPMRNLIEFERAAVQVDLIEALLGKVIIEEISFTGVKYDTERRRSGFVPGLTDRPKPVKDPDAPAMVPGLGTPVPTLEDILARQQPLLVVERAEALQATWQRQQVLIAERVNALPGQDDIAHYQQQMQELRSRPLDSIDSVQASWQQLGLVQQEVLRDGLSFAEAKLSLDQALAEFDQGLKDLSAAPADDWQRLLAEYSMDEQGMRNLLVVIFGPQAEAKVAEFEALYQQLQGYLQLIPQSEPDPDQRQRLQGRFVLFPDNDPKPNFLLKLADFDLQLPIGTFQAQLTELTSDQRVRNIPTRFQLSAVSDEFSDLALTGLFDRRQGRADGIELTTEGWRLLGRELIAEPDLQLAITQSLAQVDANWQHDGLGWRLRSDVQLRQSRLQAEGQGRWQSLVAEVLNQVSDIDLSVSMGSGAYAGLSVDSNLDNLLASAAQALVQQELAKLQQQFMAQVEALQQQLEAELLVQQQRLFAYRDEFDTRWSDYRQEVEQQLAAVESDISAKRNQLEGAAAALLREQQQALEQARQDAEAEVQRLRDEAEAEAQRLRQETEDEASRQRQQAEQRARDEAEQRANELLPTTIPRIRLPGR